ncbi:MAG: DUF4430 domain-containing protein [Clostridia bacterium]|nr:DUF4430 domain-containing protein [Clostridia bacterium]
MKKRLCMMLACLLILCSFFSCDLAEESGTESKTAEETQSAEEIAAEGHWKEAVYRKSTELGSGSKTVSVTVEADGKKIVFTLHTDKETLGEAMQEHSLLEGEESAYGLYVKKVNGILADYDVDQYYWSLQKDGVPLMTGVDGTAIEASDHFEWVRQKG